MYSREQLEKMTIKELEDLARSLYTHTPRVAKWHKEWEKDLENIRNEIKRKGGKAMNYIKGKTRNLTCDYCGKEKEGISFFIGASKSKDWTMIEGTGKMACPDCYDKAMAEGRARIDRHIKEYNQKAGSI